MNFNYLLAIIMAVAICVQNVLAYHIDAPLLPTDFKLTDEPVNPGSIKNRKIRFLPAKEITHVKNIILYREPKARRVQRKKGIRGKMRGLNGKHNKQEKHLKPLSNDKHAKFVVIDSDFTPVKDPVSGIKFNMPLSISSSVHDLASSDGKQLSELFKAKKAEAHGDTLNIVSHYEMPAAEKSELELLKNLPFDLETLTHSAEKTIESLLTGEQPNNVHEDKTKKATVPLNEQAVASLEANVAHNKKLYSLPDLDVDNNIDRSQTDAPETVTPVYNFYEYNWNLMDIGQLPLTTTTEAPPLFFPNVNRNLNTLIEQTAPHALDLLEKAVEKVNEGKKEQDDDIELRCPIHHERHGNEMFEVSECHIIKKKKH